MHPVKLEQFFTNIHYLGGYMQNIYEENRKAAERWLDSMRKAILPVDYYEYRKKFDEYVTNGGIPLDMIGATTHELEDLRVKCHIRSALQTLGFMGNDPQPEGSLLYEMRMGILRDDMKMGNFNEDFLRCLCEQRRVHDPLNEHKGRKEPTLPPAGSAEFFALATRAKRFKKVAAEALGKLRKEGLIAEEYDHLMRYFRLGLSGGFSKEELGGGVYYDLKEFGTSRKEIWELDPRNKNKKLA